MKELIEIRNSLKCPKNLENKFSNFKYRNCESILEALKPELYKHECLLEIMDNVEIIGNKTYITATVTISNKEGVKVTSKGFAAEADKLTGMAPPQVTGSCSSYARKYALNALFLIDDSTDPDDLDNREPSKKNDCKVSDLDHELEIAIQEVRESRTIGEVEAVWKRRVAFHNNPRFRNIVGTRNSELSNRSL